MSALVSIVMPAYQAAATIEKAIADIVAQTYTHWELLLYIDAATDNTAELAHLWAGKDKRIRIFQSSKNRGVIRGRNICIRLAQGNYLAFCDSDDFWIPEKLDHQLDYMSRTATNFNCTGAKYLRLDTAWVSAPTRVKGQLDLKRLLLGNPIGMSTALIQIDVLGKLYFEPLPSPYIHEDYAYWIRLFRLPKMKAAFMPEVTALVAIHPGTRSGNKTLAIQSQWWILRHIGGLNSIGVAYRILTYLGLAFYKRGVSSWAQQLRK